MHASRQNLSGWYVARFCERPPDMTRSNRVSSSTRFLLKTSFETRTVRLLNCRSQGLLLTITDMRKQNKKQSGPNPSQHTFIHTLFTGSHYNTWKRIMRLFCLILISLLTDNPPSPGKIGHTPTHLYSPWISYIHTDTNENCLQVAITIPERGSWGYLYIKISPYR